LQQSVQAQNNCNTTAIQEKNSCIAVVLHLCGPQKAMNSVHGMRRKNRNPDHHAISGWITEEKEEVKK